MLSVSGSALLAFRSTQTAAKRLGSAAGSIRSNAGKSTRTASPKPASPLVRKWLQSYHTSSSLKFEDGDFATKGTRQSKISSEEMSDLLKGITGRPKATQSESTEQSGWGYSSRASSSRGDSSERAYTSAGYSGSKSSRFGGSSEYSRPRKSFNDDYEDAAPSSKPRGGNDAWDEPQSADRASDRSASRGDRYGSDRYGGSRDGGDGFRGNRYGGARESSGDRFGSSFSGDRFGRSSGSGYGSSYGGGGSRGMAPRGDLGSRLKRKDFTEENLPPVAKNFYKESESVTAMTEEEVRAFRHLHDMEVIGEGCPRPVLNFAQTSFPVFIQKQLEKAFPKGPSHIQSQGWPLSSSGRDVVASAQTGSGKTLAFVLPALEHVAGQPKLAAGEPGADEPVALFLAPTRELAMQIHEETRRFANFYGFKTACVYGGAQNRIEQQRQLLNRPQVIIATPGRLIDFVESGAVRLGRISYVVLDEADRMLDMGFEPQVRSIMDQIRPDRQTLMWSATWPKRVQQLADSFLKNPIRIKIGSDEISANKNVTQTFAFTNWNDRLDRLVDEMQARKGQKILIFVSKKANAELLADELYDRGHRVQALHGDKPQSARTRILDDFKTGRASILIATDVAARGIDVSDIQVVINYNMPLNSEDYVHRIGRTGRAGRKGTSISFFSETDEILVPELITILEESGQEVPAEFRDVIEKRRAERAASLRSGGGYKRSSSRPRSYGGRPRSYSRR